MNLRRLLLAASCRDGARGRLARRASAEGDFVRALDETDRLLRISPPEPPDAPGARLRIARAVARIEPAPARGPDWRPAVGAGLAAAAAAAIALTPLVVWRTAAGPAAAPAPAEIATLPAPDSPRLSWTLVADFDRPLRAEVAALASDMRQFADLVAPGMAPAAVDER